MTDGVMRTVLFRWRHAHSKALSMHTYIHALSYVHAYMLHIVMHTHKFTDLFTL